MPCSTFRPARSSSPCVSEQGKEAVIAMLEPGSFFGEGCLAGQLVYMATATAVGNSTLVRIDKQAMIRVLHDEPSFSELFLTHLLSRNIRIQEDLVDQLFNSSEKRLARVLLLNGPFRERRPVGGDHSEDQSGNAGRNGRHDAVTGEFLHE